MYEWPTIRSECGLDSHIAVCGQARTALSPEEQIPQSARTNRRRGDSCKLFITLIHQEVVMGRLHLQASKSFVILFALLAGATSAYGENVRWLKRITAAP